MHLLLLKRSIKSLELIQKTYLEKTEDIELLRVLENGIPVRVIDVKSDSMAVDTPEDLIRVRKICK